MEIRDHLQDDEFVDALMGEWKPEVQEHLEHCPSCQAKHRGPLDVLKGFAEWARQSTDRPETFWQRQAAEITAQLHAPSSGRISTGFQPAWAAIAVVILLGVLLLLGPSQKPSSENAHAASNHELLVNVEQTVESDLPIALEPAALLAEEIERNSRPAVRTRTVKETHYAN
jgi:hypothetical protein